MREVGLLELSSLMGVRLDRVRLWISDPSRGIVDDSTETKGAVGSTIASTLSNEILMKSVEMRSVPLDAREES